MTANAVSIVTGGGRGIGRAITLRLAQEGAVVVVGRTEADLLSICDQVRTAGGAAELVVGNVADPNTATRAVQAALAGGRAIQNLVLNAGIGKGGPSHEFDLDIWRQIMDVNVNGSFYFAQACLPHMVERQSGTICIISSILGLRGRKYDTAYTTSKHALVGMAKALGQEYAKHGIVVVPLCPGFVESDMTRNTIANLVKYRGMSADEAEQAIRDTNPQRRIIPAEEVAELIALVCSGRINCLNGNPLILTGGD